MVFKFWFNNAGSDQPRLPPHFVRIGEIRTKNLESAYTRQPAPLQLRHRATYEASIGLTVIILAVEEDTALRNFQRFFS